MMTRRKRGFLRMKRKTPPVILSVAKNPEKPKNQVLSSAKLTISYHLTCYIKSMKKAYTYILFSKRNGTLYVGVTSDLIKRIWEHKNHVVKGFTQKYIVDKLGYYEVFDDIYDAIVREKQIKGMLRAKKIALIEKSNPTWRDLSDDLQ